MPHPELTNLSPFACELIYATDENGVNTCIALVQGTYRLANEGQLLLLEVQPPINTSGAWRGDPLDTSMLMEPQVAYAKMATDIVLCGHAYPNNAERTEGLVGLRVGAVQKLARVYGDRRFVNRMGLKRLSAPEPFEQIELSYERAFGGWDRRDPDPGRHAFEPRNPVGRGFRDPSQSGECEHWAPNIEDPEHPYTSPGDRPPPAGFGFVSPDWEPRARFAGTYDKVWSETRKPLLPVDFNRRFFNAASAGLVAPGHLVGNELVTVIGATEGRPVSFSLPGTAPPQCRIAMKRRPAIDLSTQLDTLIIDMDQRRVTVLWRAHVRVPRGIHDVVAMELPPQPVTAFDDDE